MARSKNSASGRSSRWIPAALAAAVLVLFWQTAWFDFVDYDDHLYLRGNAAIRDGLSWEGMQYAFGLVKDRFYWHPLTWISYMIDCSLAGGPDAGFHHAVNMLLHAVAVVLVYLFFARATGDPVRSGVAAALFGLHPLRVESVAWVSERKDVLCGVFFALTLLLYHRYVQRTSARRYAAVVGAFALALMTKPSAVTLPVLLLIADQWPLRRADSWRRLVVEKVPLAAMSAAVAMLAVLGSREAGTLELLDAGPFSLRAMYAAEWLCQYVWKTFAPYGMALPYPYAPHAALAPLFIALVAAITAGAVWVRRRFPSLTAGWLWFVVAVAPNLGFIQAGHQAMADRFTYFGHIGLSAGLVWTAAELLKSRGRAVGAVAIAACFVVSLAQVPVWRDSVTLFSHAVRHTPENWVARLKLAAALLDRNDATAAGPHAEAAVRLDPKSFHSYYQLARWHSMAGRPADAATAFEKSAELRPIYAEAHYGAGMMRLRAGEAERARASLERSIALGIEEQYATQAHNMIGAALAQQRRFVEALAAFDRALAVAPGNADAQRNRAMALLMLGRREEAAAFIQSILRVQPGRQDLAQLLAPAK